MDVFILDGNRAYMAYGFSEHDKAQEEKMFYGPVALPESSELPLRLEPSFGDAKKQPIKLGDVHCLWGRARLFSERAADALQLAQSGRLFPVELKDRTEPFFWYWSTTVIDCLDNVQTRRSGGDLVMEPVFLPDRIGDAEIFTAPDDQEFQFRLYVTESFKERIKIAKLKGFMLQRKIFDPKPWKS